MAQRKAKLIEQAKAKALAAARANASVMCSVAALPQSHQMHVHAVPNTSNSVLENDSKINEDTALGIDLIIKREVQVDRVNVQSTERVACSLIVEEKGAGFADPSLGSTHRELVDTFIKSEDNEEIPGSINCHISVDYDADTTKLVPP